MINDKREEKMSNIYIKFTFFCVCEIWCVRDYFLQCFNNLTIKENLQKTTEFLLLLLSFLIN